MFSNTLASGTYILDSKGHQQELSAEKGFMITGAAFNANGNVLCFWTSGAAADHAYFYDVGSMPAVLSGTSSYEKVIAQQTHKQSTTVLILCRHHWLRETSRCGPTAVLLLV